MKRFYLPELPVDAAPGQRLVLDGSEAHHLLHVLRIGTGEQVEIFDGRGGSIAAEVTRPQRREVELSTLSERTTQQRTGPEVALATCVPKQDRFRWLVEKATELGVSRIVPLVTQRSVVEPGSGKLERLHDTVVQACKQCGRNDLLTIETPAEWRDFVNGWSAKPAQEKPMRPLWVASPDGTRWTSMPGGPPREITIAIGPEGGFTNEEVAAALAAGARSVSLGMHTLRTETAAIAAAALAAVWRASVSDVDG